VRKAVIWDLDGTLLDSYDVIVESLQLTMDEQGIETEYHDIWQHTITFSVSSFLKEMSERYDIPLDLLKQRYAQTSGSKYRQIKRMEHAVEILQKLRSMGVEHYVFTHRGKTTLPVLENLGLTGYFKEIFTSQSGFARKPAPDAIVYLLGKYDLDREHTYYAGDRNLDMQCARNAGISGILFLADNAPGNVTGEETYIVNDLLEIAEIV